ncbi:prepilin-type N-terminal cleavage/methylation domain-containing protein [Duganella sp. FT80W]|uniref:Prepilin-type N-terminal cleavage/methylation domain-containing protein n=1 Tax=Duganella guangzhouensis TaxID=2666084 RepID=A0A6I2L975_9BURK|nr:type IV pilin protein [Duganella guangzhouensis]MRW94343.1 prepilin-type N-terminal cleavage/methylation domain-containing protein [Duganella guangzhouensis]
MKRSGFSLIELLVVLLILAVLAAQAMPAYQQHVIRTRRNEAQAALLKLMMQQERFYSQHNTYIAFSSASSEPEAKHFQWWSAGSPKSSAYELEGKACEGEPLAQCVRIVATPGTAQVDSGFHDDACDVLTLTSTGLRLASGPAAGCWP